MKNVRSAHVFDLKLLKEFFLVFGIYCNIHSMWKGKHHKTIKDNLTQFTWCSTPTHLHWLNDILSRNEKLISVDSFSLVLLKEKVEESYVRGVDKSQNTEHSGTWKRVAFASKGLRVTFASKRNSLRGRATEILSSPYRFGYTMAKVV